MTSTWQQRLIGELSVRRLVTSLIAIYAILVAYLYVREDAMVFQPQPSSYRDGPDVLKLVAGDGRRISALWAPNPKARYTLLYSHGNAEDIGENRPVLQRLHDLGFAVLMYDYHGYGTSEGTPGEATSTLDIEAAYRYLVETRRVPPERLILYGRSVGGGPTLALATRRPARALVLESTFTDPARVLVPVQLLPWVMFPSLARIRAYHGPVLVMHGRADQTIPFAHGRALYEAAPGPKQCLWVDGADHDDFKEVAGARYDRALLEFTRSLAAARS